MLLWLCSYCSLSLSQLMFLLYNANSSWFGLVSSLWSLPGLPSPLGWIGWPPHPRTVFSVKAEREKEERDTEVGLPGLAYKSTGSSVKFAFQILKNEYIFKYNYVPCNIWDMLILKKDVLFIWNSNFSGDPVFYLTTLYRRHVSILLILAWVSFWPNLRKYWL